MLQNYCIFGIFVCRRIPRLELKYLELQKILSTDKIETKNIKSWKEQEKQKNFVFI